MFKIITIMLSVFVIGLSISDYEEFYVITGIVLLSPLRVQV
ncbi:hypothetical protein QGM71_19800 [Virgibacillus sp. C22-A2]|uniref:Uncharacterized protein n=1 Tax=Virgibacillus tibetensis TaxID=3042313 RepID=A0ABU6KMF5_9BACI|nr:hypothetical protein [Virgibacillus sp. C22-A2]